MRPRLALVRTRDSVICAFVVRQNKKTIELAPSYDLVMKIFPVTFTVRRRDVVLIELF